MTREDKGLSYDQMAFLTLYKKFYGEEYEPNNEDCKVKGQIMVYLLQQKGINCGDYGFLWDNYDKRLKS